MSNRSTGRRWWRGLVAVVALAAGAAIAGGAESPVVAKAVADLAVLRARAEAMRPGDGPTAQGIMKDLAAVGAALASVPDKTDPSWVAAATEYNALNTAVPAKYKATGADGPDPDIAAVNTLLDGYQARLDAMARGDTKAGVKLLEELKAVAARIQRVTTQFHPEYKALTTRYNSLNQAIAAKANAKPAPGATVAPAGGAAAAPALSSMQATQFNRLTRGVAGTLQLIERTDDAEAVTEAFAAKVGGAIEGYRSQWAAIGREDHPDVVELGRRIESLPAALASRVEAAGAAREALGDYEARLAAIAAESTAEVVPGMPSMPFEPEEVRVFAERALRIVARSDENLKYLETLKGSAFAPRDLSSRVHWQGVRRRQAAEVLEQAQSVLALNVKRGLERVEFIADPAKAQQVLLNEGTFAETGRFLGEYLMTVAAAEALFGAVGASGSQAEVRAARVRAVEVRDALEARSAEAVAGVRMPAAASTDRSLLQTAREVLTSGRYEGIGPIEAMVVNSEPVRRERREGEVAGTVSGATVTVTTYAWEEYQVTTAERAGDRLYLHFNTLKRFSSGGSTTPLNRWVLSGRFRGSQILAKNLP